MKMSRLLLCPALVLCLGLALLFEPDAAQAAKRISLQNATPYKINTVLVVQTRNGWRVHGWYAVNPYSTRSVNFKNAGGQNFGYYAHIVNGPRVFWAGKNNDPTILVSNSALNHGVRQTPYGNNLRRVKVRMRQGNSVKFTYSGPRQQRSGNSGWW